MTDMRATVGADEYAPMDISSLLDSEETIAEYLTAAAEDDDPRVLMLAIADVAKARGMAHVAEAAGLGRESLYKALAPGAHPRFETIVAVLRALGVKVTVRGNAAAKTRSKVTRPKPPKTGSTASTAKSRDLVKAVALAKRRKTAKRAPAKRRA
jgi:probable addiction module antidote protein